MTKIIAIFSVIIVTVVVSAPARADSAHSTLEQQITAIDCNHTTVETGMGIVNNDNCPTFPPSVETINANEGKPIIIGVYDAIHTHMLQVRFHGKMYRFGVDPELTVNGNVWKLDLSGLADPLPAGDYPVAVQTTNHDGATAEANNTLKITTNSNNSPPSMLPATGQSTVVMIVIAIGLIASAIILLIARKR